MTSTSAGKLRCAAATNDGSGAPGFWKKPSTQPTGAATGDGKQIVARFVLYAEGQKPERRIRNWGCGSCRHSLRQPSRSVGKWSQVQQQLRPPPARCTRHVIGCCPKCASSSAFVAGIPSKVGTTHTQQIGPLGGCVGGGY